jgi:Piwi domain
METNQKNDDVKRRDRDRFFLNCLRVDFSLPELQVRVSPWDENLELDILREQVGSDWFLHRKGEEVLGLAIVQKPKKTFGDEDRTLNLKSYEGLDFVRARLNSVLPDLLPKYHPERIKPFRFLAQKKEFVRSITEDWAVASVVREFFIRPRFELEAKTVELAENRLQVVIAFSVGMQWDIEASLRELHRLKVPLTGLYVIRREVLEKQRRLIGRIAQVTADTIELSESFDGETSVSIDSVRLEGSKTSFTRCLQSLLTNRYSEFESQREVLEAEYTTGEAFAGLITAFTQTPRSVSLSPGLVATVAKPIAVENKPEEPVYVTLPPVDYCFDAAKTKRKQLGWEGLVEFGPFDRDTFDKRNPRLLVVVPQSHQTKAEQVLQAFVEGIPETTFAVGFTRLFNLRQVKFDTCSISDQRLDRIDYAKTYRGAIESHLANGGSYDGAIVVVPDGTQRMADSFNPYLHAKALLLTNGIPVQEIRVPTLYQTEFSLPYILRNIAVSMYAKLDGTPWTVSQPRTFNDELVIGMGTAELSGSRVLSRQRHIGITTVFLGDGNFLLSNVSKECSYDDYPEVLKAATKSVLTEVKKRNGWEQGDRIRIVFHSSKPLKNVEIDELISECVKEVAGEQTVEFASLHVSQWHGFKVVDKWERGVKFGRGLKGVFAPARGFVMQLGANTRLLVTNGPYQMKRGISPLPSPLLIHLHKQSTSRSLDALAEQILKFTSMTWRSTTPAAMPVTIYYSELIAGLLARLRSIPDWSPALLNTKLRASKWFL